MRQGYKIVNGPFSVFSYEQHDVLSELKPRCPFHHRRSSRVLCGGAPRVFCTDGGSDGVAVQRLVLHASLRGHMEPTGSILDGHVGVAKWAGMPRVLQVGLASRGADALLPHARRPRVVGGAFPLLGGPALLLETSIATCVLDVQERIRLPPLRREPTLAMDAPYDWDALDRTTSSTRLSPTSRRRSSTSAPSARSG